MCRLDLCSRIDHSFIDADERAVLLRNRRSGRNWVRGTHPGARFAHSSLQSPLLANERAASAVSCEGDPTIKTEVNVIAKIRKSPVRTSDDLLQNESSICA